MPSTKDPDNGFVEWLLATLEEKRWSPADLAQAADVYQSVISGLINRERGLGVDIAKKLAVALGVSQYDIFRISGLIDEEILDDDKASKEYLRLLASIEDDDDRQTAINAVEAVIKTIAERSKANRPKHAGRPSTAKGKA